jgi:hypothetical protein
LKEKKKKKKQKKVSDIFFTQISLSNRWFMIARKCPCFVRITRYVSQKNEVWIWYCCLPHCDRTRWYAL